MDKKTLAKAYSWNCPHFETAHSIQCFGAENGGMAPFKIMVHKIVFLVLTLNLPQPSQLELKQFAPKHTKPSCLESGSEKPFVLIKWPPPQP